MFKFTLTIATSVFLLLSSADHGYTSAAFGDDNSKRTNSNSLATIIPCENISRLSMEAESRIIEYAAFDQCLDNQKPVNLMLVCKDWLQETEYHMQVGKPCWKAWHGIIGHEDIYETFLNGVLIYKPDPNSDEGLIRLKISELLNPLEGTFDLSKCGDEGEYLVISTGYCKGINPANKGKTEIWITPRFLIEKKIASAPHLSGIMQDWDENVAPVGVFFTWSSDLNKHFDYCTSKDLNFISENNFHKIWTARLLNLMSRVLRYRYIVRDFEMFSCSFLNQNMNY